VSLNVIVNGEEYGCQQQCTLATLIGALQLENSVMAAAVNMEIVKKEQWSTRELHEKDKVELLDFVGGG